MLNKVNWLSNTVQCDEKGRLPSLENAPLEYTSRQEMYNRRIQNGLMFDEDINKEYNDYVKWHHNELQLDRESKGDDQC